LLYPCFVLLFTIGVTVFMLVKIIPELQKFLSIMGRKLPPMTQALIDASGWFQTYTPAIAAGLAAALAVLIGLYRWPPGRLALDTLVLRLPLFGRLFRLSGTVVFARSMEALLRSGVHILEALETVQGLHRNRYLAQCVAHARKRVAEGASLSESLAARFGYMPMLARMMVIGENSGRLDEMLEEMGAFHQELLAKDIRRMSGMIAPAMTVVVGGIIGFVYAAFLTAMFAAGGGSPK
jgi:type IV pilus assembly protein PilC